MHQRSSGIRAAEETHQHVIQDFIKSLKPKIKNKFANKFAEGSFQPRTLDHEFSLALDLEKKIQIANSFRDDIMDSRTPATINEVQSHPWMNLMLLTKFCLVLVTETIIPIIMARATTAASMAPER